MSDEKFGYMFKGSAQQYVTHIRQQLYRFKSHFVNIYSGFGAHEFHSLSKKNDQFIFELGRAYLKPGDNIKELKNAGVDFPLTFKDGSILSISQTFEEQKKSCWIKKSVIAFNKVIDDRVQYTFHYDIEHGVINHPDYHLQFDYDSSIKTPRFDIGVYQSIEDILQMIIRDNLLDND